MQNIEEEAEGGLGSLTEEGAGAGAVSVEQGGLQQKKKKKKKKKRGRGADAKRVRREDGETSTASVSSSQSPVSESGSGNTANPEDAVDPSRIPAGLTDDERDVWILAEEKMASLVGQEKIKDKLRSFLIEMVYDRRHSGEQRVRHIYITGPTGVGKTVLARMIGELLYALELVNGRFKEVCSADLKGGNNVRNELEACEGGILFIDEAYLLGECLATNGLLTRNIDPSGFVCTGAEAPPSSDDKDEDEDAAGGGGATVNTLVITAGYREQMLRWLDAGNSKGNRGLGARISRHFAMANYSVDELVDIAQMMLATKPAFGKATLADDDARAALRAACTKIAAMDPETKYANARGVEDLLGCVKTEHAWRGVRCGCTKYTKEEIEKGVRLWQDEIEDDTLPVAAGPSTEIHTTAADYHALRRWWYELAEEDPADWVQIMGARNSLISSRPGLARTLGIKHGENAAFVNALQEAMRQTPGEDHHADDDGAPKEIKQTARGRTLPSSGNGKVTKDSTSIRGWRLRS